MECTVTCACGATVKTRSVKPEIRVDVCSKCHPFFTRQQRFVDTAGRVEKFNRRYAKGKSAPPAAPAAAS